MSRVFALTTVLIFSCTIGIMAATGVSRNVVKKAIQAQYDKGLKALKAEDARAYAAICTPDATFAAPHKAPETLKEHLSHIGPNPDPESVLSSERVTINRLRLTPNGDRATVDAEDVSMGTLTTSGGKPDSSGQLSHWSLVLHTHALWLRQQGVWRLKKSAILPGSVFRLDGKVIPASDGDLSP